MELTTGVVELNVTTESLNLDLQGIDYKIGKKTASVALLCICTSGIVLNIVTAYVLSKSKTIRKVSKIKIQHLLKSKLLFMPNLSIKNYVIIGD